MYTIFCQFALKYMFFFARELISTPDGGTLSLDWYDPKSLGASLPLSFSFPICLFIPGLTGTSRAEYLRLLISLAHSTGYRAVVLNHRGLAGTPLTSSRFYCAATHADLEFALRHIRKLNPTVRLVASGLSMGGTILAGYLVGAGTHSLIDAAFLISTCWDLKKGAQQLRRGFWSARFNKYLTRLIVTAVLKHREVFLKGGYNFDFDSFTSFTSLHQFDGAFTIKMFGFPSTDAYYKAASFSDRVNEIKVPTLCLNSADDMLAPEADLPLKQVQSCDHVAMVVTARGGHLGFMESALMPSLEPTFYLERLFGQYIKALFEMKETPRSLAN